MLKTVSALALVASALMMTSRIARAQVPAATIIELYANVSVGARTDFVVIDSSGTKSDSPFKLPVGALLVVTDVIVTPNAVEGTYFGNIDSVGGNENRVRILLHSPQQAMLHLPFASGVVFSTDPRAFGGATNPGAFVIRLLGYLERPHGGHEAYIDPEPEFRSL